MRVLSHQKNTSTKYRDATHYDAFPPPLHENASSNQIKAPSSLRGGLAYLYSATEQDAPEDDAQDAMPTVSAKSRSRT